MPDIKFNCPECTQRIAVDWTAAGLNVDCPACRSTLVIPATSESAATVSVRRKLAVPAGGQDALYAELEKRKTELDSAVAESLKLRADAEKAQNEAEQARAERETFRSANEKATGDVKKLRDELDKLASVRDILRNSSKQQEPALDEQSKKEIQVLRSSLLTLQRERDELSTKLTAMSHLRDQLATLTTERSKLALESSEARRDADALRSEVTSLQSRYKQADAHAEEWKSQLSAMQRERDELLTKAKGVESLPAEL